MEKINEDINEDIKKRPIIAIFCGARLPAVSPDQLNALTLDIQEMCHKLADHYDLVYGGGTVGLMGVVASQFLKSGANVFGVIPKYLSAVEAEHSGLTAKYEVDDLYARKEKMESLANLFLILPGGIGTADEFFEVLTLKMLKRHQKKIIVWNWNHFFDGVVTFLQDGIRLGFVDQNVIQHCVMESEFPQVVKFLLPSGSKVG